MSDEMRKLREENERLQLELMKWRQCLCDVHHLAEGDPADVGLMEIGQAPDGTWLAWDSEYPEDGSVKLEGLAEHQGFCDSPGGGVLHLQRHDCRNWRRQRKAPP